MSVVQDANSDWRDSLCALNSANGFKFIISNQIHRANQLKYGEDSATSDLHRRASAGNPVAMEQLGICLLQASESKHLETGADWLRRSAGTGNPIAMHLLAEQLIATSDCGCAGDAHALLEQALAQNFLPAQVALGAHLLECSPHQNAPRALKLLRDAAARGSRFAHVVLATSLIGGHGVPVDRDAGFGWLRRLGVTTPRKVSALGSFLYARARNSNAKERRQLSRHAAVLFEESIRQGYLDNEVTLAYLIRRGEVRGEGFASLDLLLQRHLAKGDSHALINQALRLARGVGCAVDWQTADTLVAKIFDSRSVLSWYQPRAREGDVEGQLVIGWLVRHNLCAYPSGNDLAESFDAARANGWKVPDWMYSKASRC